MNITSWSQWRYIVKKLIDGVDCVLCGKPAETLHHPHPKEYYVTKRFPFGIDLVEYWNDKTQIPMCRECHETKWHITKTFPATQKMRKIDSNIVKFKKCMGGGFDEQTK